MAENIDLPGELTTPAGDWDVWLDEVSIVGERHRLVACRDYINGLKRAAGAGLRFGVDLVREPSNPHDPFAIKVLGFWQESGWLGPKRLEAHIGYLSAPLAYKIAKGATADTPLGACLKSLELEEDDDFDPLNIVIDVLRPKGGRG